MTKMRKRKATVTMETEIEIPPKNAIVRRGTINPENYNLRVKKQADSMQRPKVFITADKLKGDQKPEEQSESEGEQTEGKSPELSIRDLQYLLLYALRKGINLHQPEWCHMLRPGKMASAILIVLNDVSITDFEQNNECFPFLQRTFSEGLRVTMENPRQNLSTFSFEMFAIPMTFSQLNTFRKRHGNISYRNGVKVLFAKPAIVPDSQEKASANSSDNNDEKDEDTSAVCRTQLMLSASQMVEENYPLPGEEDSEEKYADFVMSKEAYSKVTSNSSLFAVDCEMCLTSAFKHELTRVSVINEQKEVIYDELVKPHNRIINYLTRYSGITKKVLEPVTKRLEDVQREICEMLPSDAILCGQSLGGDLNALQMFHPYVMDTSVLYNLSGSRKVKCSLKGLAHSFLGRVIQESKSGHNSVEDAMATMDLVLLKLRKSLTFGDAVMDDIQPCHLAPVDVDVNGPSQGDVNHNGLIPDSEDTQPLEHCEPGAVMMRSLFDQLSDQGVSACQIGAENLVSQYRGQPGLTCCVTTSDKEVSKKARELCKGYKFAWVEFSPLADLLAAAKVAQEEVERPEEAREEASDAITDMKGKRKALKAVDKLVQKLMEQLPEKCLVSLVMTGNRGSRSSLEHAAVFLHIT